MEICILENPPRPAVQNVRLCSPYNDDPFCPHVNNPDRAAAEPGHHKAPPSDRPFIGHIGNENGPAFRIHERCHLPTLSRNGEIVRRVLAGIVSKDAAGAQDGGIFSPVTIRGGRKALL